MKKVIVTGGLGYIGSQTMLQLFRSGEFEPIAVDSCIRSNFEIKKRIESIVGQPIKHYNINLCNKSDFFNIFEQEKEIDTIIHFAAFKSVPESMEKPLEYYRNNLESLENVLEACSKFGVKNLIFSSSCSIYGDVAQLPVNEDTPTNDLPLCPYAHTKLIGEGIIRFYANRHPETKYIALRYFNPIGADETGKIGESPKNSPGNLLPIMMEVAYGIRQELCVFGTDYDTRDGSCIRDYVHVADIADAHVAAVQYLHREPNAPVFDVINLGTGNGISVLEMIASFERVTGIKLNVKMVGRRAGDVPAIYSNSTKAQELLGWSCKRNLDEMISSAWAWEQEKNKKN
ncbi:MAG: UDP-glucose 4-epimerase GalE [Bacteroidales bacterium]|nr:UDP-glucose 4-epimerase GalE [Bacteroidales bacterium]